MGRARDAANWDAKGALAGNENRRARLRLVFSSPAHGRNVLRLIRMVAAIGLLSALAALAAGSAVGAEISGAGAAFPYPVYAGWAEGYKEAAGVGVDYQP